MSGMPDIISAPDIDGNEAVCDYPNLITIGEINSLSRFVPKIVTIFLGILKIRKWVYHLLA
jgi:hypothetical protein